MNIYRAIARVSILVGASLIIGCGDTIVRVESPTAPAAPTEVITRIEFRVTGNASSARIRYVNQQDGLVQTVSTLPFFTSFTTKSDTLFLSLEVTPISYPTIVQFPFLSAQIFAGNNLFREVTSNEFFLNTISVSGQWRR